LALVNAEMQKQESQVVTSQVRFRQLDKQRIKEYLTLVPVLDKAGAYGIQDHGEMLVESIDGELENIIGLPVAALAELLDKLQIK